MIRPEIGADGTRVTLRAPDVDDYRFDVDLDSARRDVVLFKDRYRGIDQGDDVAGWLLKALGRPCRLFRVPPERDRVSDGFTTGASGYADGAAVLVASESSLEQLNGRLAARGAQRLPIGLFRPNIVVSGWDEPHAEDRIRRVAVGTAELGYAKLTLAAWLP